VERSSANPFQVARQQSKGQPSAISAVDLKTPLSPSEFACLSEADGCSITSANLVGSNAADDDHENFPFLGDGH